MKQIIIFLLIVILGFIAWGQYKKYKRFSLSDYGYTIPENVDVNYHDQDKVLNYYKAIESLNGFVITQWSANDIDVRNPKSDNEKTKAAVAQYRDKMAAVKFYEALLQQSANWKSKGLSNNEIMAREKNLKSEEDLAVEENGALIKQLFTGSSNRDLRIGDTGAMVFELQKLLVKEGYDIPTDGIFKNITAEALKDFETKHQLFPDGKLDALTLNALLN